MELIAKLQSLKTSLIYDKVNTFGGAERVLLALHQLFPQAPLYTSVYHPHQASWAKVFPQVIPSFLQIFPFAKNHPQWYTPLMPLAFETLNLNQYDLVISITSGEAKGIITRPGTLHLCYCLTPSRYLWVDPGYSGYQHFGLFNPLVNLAKPFFLSRLHSWDLVAASRPDAYATISQTVASRVEKYYHRSSVVIHPPVDTDFFKPATNTSSQKLNVKGQMSKNNSQNYFLLVSRLVPYKKVDLAIRTFQQLNLPLKIVGTGPDFHHLKRMTNHTPTVELLGHVSESQLLRLYQHCSSLIMPQEEDFGLVALEAQACGKPVIAFNQGGATENVVNHQTGLFFNRQTPDSLISAIKKFQTLKFSSQACRAQALKFSLDNFQVRMREWVTSQVANNSNIILSNTQ